MLGPEIKPKNVRLAGFVDPGEEEVTAARKKMRLIVVPRAVGSPDGGIHFHLPTSKA